MREGYVVARGVWRVLAARRLEGEVGSFFREFLPYWNFVNRESGEVHSFASLWPGQESLLQVIEEHDWVLALKAGKLGFTELECAYDAWVALFRQSNARVHIFSRDLSAAKELIGYIRFGLERLPEPIIPQFLEEEAGGKTSTSLKWRVSSDDTRSIVSFSTGESVSIDQSCTHAHVDELAHMANPAKMWAAVQTTVAPGGSCHIVTRGAGMENYVAELWAGVEKSGGNTKLYPFFQPYTARPGRDRAWKEKEAETLTTAGLSFWAPETPEDALVAEGVEDFVPLVWWDACYDPNLPLLQPGNAEVPVVMGVDGAVRGDCFGVVLVSRHPSRPEEVAVRACRAWYPPKGGAIELEECEAFIHQVCDLYNVVCLVYDPFQLEQMMQRLRREAIVWCEPFNQKEDRLKADNGLRDAIIHRRLWHDGNKQLREHIDNAASRTQPREDSKLRMEKKTQSRKIDLAVALSMAHHQCLYLRL